MTEVMDPIGASTLERLAPATAFNRWMYERLAPWIGDRVIEIGSGIGNISQFLVDRERVVLTDMNELYRERLARRFGGHTSVSVRALTLPMGEGDSELRGQFDTVVCLNVLEHIRDDRAALSSMRDLLAEGGRVVLLVPALPFLFGTLDEALGHYRRYTKRGLMTLFDGVGLHVTNVEYFNTAGIPGWWFVGRVLNRKLIPAQSLTVYDKLVPLFRLERMVPWRIGQSIIVVGRR